MQMLGAAMALLTCTQGVLGSRAQARILARPLPRHVSCEDLANDREMQLCVKNFAYPTFQKNVFGLSD